MTKIGGSSNLISGLTPSLSSSDFGGASLGPMPGGSYMVQSGDTLWGISQKAYGDGNGWREIADANPDVVGQNGGVQAGATLQIPQRQAADRVSQDAGSAAKKIIDDGKPKDEGATPKGDPALQGNLNAMRNQANVGSPFTITHDNNQSFLDEKKDVTDEAGKAAKGKTSITLGETKRNFKEGGVKKNYVKGKGFVAENNNVTDETDKKKFSDNVNVNATLASVQARASADFAKAEGETKLGENTTAKGQVHAGHVSALGSAAVGVDIKNATIKADVSGRVEAQLVGAEGSVKHTSGVGTTTIKGKAYVGAEATGNVTVNIDPRKGAVKVGAGVDLFVGAKASAQISQSFKVGGHNLGAIGAKGEAYAGAGVKLNAEVGIEKGHFKASVEVGAALGIGAGVKLNIDVDVKGTYNAAKEGIGNAYQGAKSVAASAWNKVSSWW